MRRVQLAADCAQPTRQEPAQVPSTWTDRQLFQERSICLLVWLRELLILLQDMAWPPEDHWLDARALSFEVLVCRFGLQAALPETVEYLLKSRHLKPQGLWDGLLQRRARDITLHE